MVTLAQRLLTSGRSQKLHFSLPQVVGAQVLGPSSTAFPGALAVHQMESRITETQTVTLIGDAIATGNCQWQLNLLCYSPIILPFKLYCYEKTATLFSVHHSPLPTTPNGNVKLPESRLGPCILCSVFGCQKGSFLFPPISQHPLAGTGSNFKRTHHFCNQLVGYIASHAGNWRLVFLSGKEEPNKAKTIKTSFILGQAGELPTSDIGIPKLIILLQIPNPASWQYTLWEVAVME